MKRDRRCPHPKYSDGHCAEMVCWNYVNRCPRHAVSGRDYERCSREGVHDDD